MCYDSLVNLAPFVGALRAMRRRHAVTLTTPKADVCLPPVYHEQRRATLLESTLVEVFILNSLNLFRMNTFFAQFWCNLSPFRMNTCKSVSKQTTLSPFRMNTYEKTGGRGRVHFPLLTQKNEGSAIHHNLLTSLLPYFILQKRQRPFRSDGGICEKGAPSSGEKIVTAQRLSFPAVRAEEAHSSEISLRGPARSCSPRVPPTAPPPAPSPACSPLPS